MDNNDGGGGGGDTGGGEAPGGRYCVMPGCNQRQAQRRLLLQRENERWHGELREAREELAGERAEKEKLRERVRVLEARLGPGGLHTERVSLL